MSGRLVVVGGGISGLAAARRLSADWQVVVLDGAGHLGGKLAAISLEDVSLDGGAESFLVRRPEATDLVGELGLGSQLVHPTPARPMVYVDGRPVPLPPNLLGVPTDVAALDGLVTPAGLRQASLEPGAEWPPLTGDVAIGRVVDEHFGPEVTDRLLEPMLGGVYAGRSRELSFEAVAPALFERARGGGSLVRHALEVSDLAPDGPVFGGLVGGVSGLVGALVGDLSRRGVELRTGRAVRELTGRPGGGYVLTAGPVPAPERIEADAVVLAAPARATGRLLAGLTAVGGAWAGLPYASTAVVTLVVTGADLVGSGLLVPPGGLPTIKALTHSSVKWDWVASAATARWGARAGVVRASVGRLGEEPLLQLPDEALLQRTFAEAAGLPGWESARLVTGHVSRWGGGLPQYLVGHRGRVDALRRALEDHPGLAVCGAALDGIGIAACLGSADAAATKIDAELGTRT